MVILMHYYLSTTGKMETTEQLFYDADGELRITTEGNNKYILSTNIHSFGAYIS